nr:RHS repeat-associated core domain-containing protein [Clostridium beijerinckii]
MNRLKEASYDDRREVFTYDKVGNRLTKTTTDITEKYIYNVKNQLKELHKESGISYFTYDKQGNTIKEETTTGNNIFEYNTLNQQVNAITKEGNTLVSRYDTEGLRAEIEENEKLTKFIFNKENVLVETDKDYNVISRFTRGYEVIATDIADLSESSEANLNRHYYTVDEQGSTIFITDQRQQIRNEYYYDAFGNVLEAQEEVHNRITYTGQQFDGITGQYYLRARFYNPVIGRFTQEDTYRGDGLNLYAYCGNNPVTYYDPSGYSSLSKENPFALENELPEGGAAGDNIGNMINGAGNPTLYRKMSTAEAEKTLENGLQPARRGAEPTKWTSESLEKVKEFDNLIVKPETKEVIVEFEMNPEYYKNMQESAVPQFGSKGNPNVKYHYEGLEVDGPYKNYGITPEQIDLFNSNILNKRIIK